MAAIGIGFFSLYLAVVFWVYFDALERGRAAIPWAISVLLLSWALLLPIVLYAIVRDRDEHEAPPGSGKRQYLYVASLTGLVMTAIGLALVIGATIVNLVSESGSGGYTEGTKEGLAAGIVSALIGGIVWLVHWLQAYGRLSALTDDEFRWSFSLHRAYVYTVLGLFWISAAIGALWLLGGGVSDLLGAGFIESNDWLPAFAPVVVALIVVGYHQMHQREPIYAAWAQRLEMLTPATAGHPSETTAAPAPGGGRFCTSCGAGVRKTDTFCAACGTQLR